MFATSRCSVSPARTIPTIAITRLFQSLIKLLMLFRTVAATSELLACRSSSRRSIRFSRHFGDNQYSRSTTQRADRFRLSERFLDSGKAHWQARSGAGSCTALGTAPGWRRSQPHTGHARRRHSGGSGCTGTPFPLERPRASRSPWSTGQRALPALGTCPRFPPSPLREVFRSVPRPARCKERQRGCPEAQEHWSFLRCLSKYCWFAAAHRPKRPRVPPLPATRSGSHCARHGSFGDPDSELLQFAMNPWCSSQGIGLG